MKLILTKIELMGSISLHTYIPAPPKSLSFVKEERQTGSFSSTFLKVESSSFCSSAKKGYKFDLFLEKFKLSTPSDFYIFIFVWVGVQNYWGNSHWLNFSSVLSDEIF